MISRNKRGPARCELAGPANLEQRFQNADLQDTSAKLARQAVARDLTRRALACLADLSAEDSLALAGALAGLAVAAEAN